MAASMQRLEAMKESIMQNLCTPPVWESDIDEIARNSDSLVRLDWDFLGIDAKTLEKLSEALKHNTKVNYISISGNALKDAEIITLCKAIRRNKELPLTELNLSFNEITKESGRSLEHVYMRPGLSVHVIGNPIEKDLDVDSALRQTRKKSEKKKKKPTKRKSVTVTTSTPKPNAPASEKEGFVKLTRAKTDLTPTTLEANSLDIANLEKEIEEMEENEQDYIIQIEELEHKIIRLMRDRTATSFKTSHSLWGKFKRSLTLEKKNVVITRKLAAVGGSGAGVYSCLVDGWKCAMKELDTTSMSQYMIDGFLGEIQLLELLPQHDNIARYLFHEISGNRIRLFMTQYHGSLGSYMQNRKEKTFAVSQIWKICLDIIKGIEFLHHHGIIHRDLKSDNIFVVFNEKGEILQCAIGDFDTAKQINSKADAAKTVLGTPAWMAPEVMDAKALGSYSFACDIYSFGMILYEMLAGKMPYEGTNPMKIPMMVLQGDLPEEPQVTEEYQPLLELYLKCVAFKPKNRPSVKTVKATIANNLVK